MRMSALRALVIPDGEIHGAIWRHLMVSVLVAGSWLADSYKGCDCCVEASKALKPTSINNHVSVTRNFQESSIL